MRKTQGICPRKTASLLVLLTLVALPSAHAQPPGKPSAPRFEHVSAPCEANRTQPDYLPGVDVYGNRVVPADLDGGASVDLQNVTVNPVVPVGHGRQKSDVIVQGVKLAKPVPACVPKTQHGVPPASH